MNISKFVVIMAAGRGSRMGAELPKQFLKIGNRTILEITIDKFLEALPNAKIIVVLPGNYIAYWKQYCLTKGFLAPQIIVPGGITRFHSVKNALDKVQDGGIVAVHDGVRPLVSKALIKQMFAMVEAENIDGLVPVCPMFDSAKTLVLNSVGELTSCYDAEVDRSKIYGAQTPQVFNSTLLKQAYTLPYKESYTDDASVVEAYIKKSLTYCVGERYNIKITTPEDLKVAKALL